MAVLLGIKRLLLPLKGKCPIHPPQFTKPIVLTDGGGSLTRYSVKLDYALLDQFLKRFDSKCGLTGGQRSFPVSNRSIMLHQPVIAAQTKKAKALTYHQHPVVIPPEQQVSMITRQAGDQAVQQSRFQLAVGQRERWNNRRLELNNIEPNRSPRRNSRLAALRDLVKVAGVDVGGLLPGIQRWFVADRTLAFSVSWERKTATVAGSVDALGVGKTRPVWMSLEWRSSTADGPRTAWSLANLETANSTNWWSRSTKSRESIGAS
jgi:hypothetical protein